MFKPRQPNQQEKEELFNYVSTLWWYDLEDPSTECRDAVEKAAIAVFDNFNSEGRGYTGKLMTVIWRGGPQMYQVFIWRDGEIIPTAQDPQFEGEELDL